MMERRRREEEERKKEDRGTGRESPDPGTI